MKYTSSPDDSPDPCTTPLSDCTNRVNRRKAIKKRKRKSMSQLEILYQEFQQYPDWDKQHISRIMKRTGLTEAQIYKWGWDQKKKLGYQEKVKKLEKSNLSELFASLPDVKPIIREPSQSEWWIFSCCETLMPHVIDFHFNKLQKSYKELSEELKQDNTYKKNLSCVFESFINDNIN
ncbi:hypothetical protein SteCoe_12028 [Stentor coeruleus]|uniref:Homeobox domain-containing protein n=1 Tax=Stentor coeruleus TaxID=5963 RepID=A0A1R2CBQ7_9CILI|nr:hypothetical protein SteCoe_12028 [Stentor coeruleus]